MPVYEYEADCGQCDVCGGRFEFFQKITDPPLKVCPVCERPVHRVVSRIARPKGNVLSNTNLAEKGFTKYTRTSDGTYEKQAGSGPDLAGGTAKRRRKR